VSRKFLFSASQGQYALSCAKFSTMKKPSFMPPGILLLLLGLSIGSIAQKPANWTEKQLMEPADLANTIAAKNELPVIISVGPGAVIPNSFDAGMASTPEGLEKLKAHLKTIDTHKKIVIYCGCCPFDHCPNVRPAIELLKEMHFTNYYLLNLSHNIRKDWIEKGYPVAAS
jgi:hypothetical protein